MPDETDIDLSSSSSDKSTGSFSTPTVTKQVYLFLFNFYCEKNFHANIHTGKQKYIRTDRQQWIQNNLIQYF